MLFISTDSYHKKDVVRITEYSFNLQIFLVVSCRYSRVSPDTMLKTAKALTDVEFEFYMDIFNESRLDANGRLTLAYQELCKIPKEISQVFASRTTELDLSFNHFWYPLVIVRSSGSSFWWW